MMSERSSSDILGHGLLRLNPARILADRFRVSYDNGDRRRSALSFCIFAALPVALGLLLTWLLSVPPGATIALIVASFGILAAVLVGLLPVIHGLVSQANVERGYTLGEMKIGELELARLRSLRELYAVIAYSILLLILGVAASTALAALYELSPLEPVESRAMGLVDWMYLVASFLIYFVASSTAFSFFDLASGVYDALESQADESERMIRDQLARTRGSAKNAQDTENV